MSAIDVGQLADRYTSLWTEPDPSARRQAIEDLWAKDAVEHTGASQYRGHDAIAGRVTAAHQQFFETRENLLQLADSQWVLGPVAEFGSTGPPGAGGRTKPVHGQRTRAES